MQTEVTNDHTHWAQGQCAAVEWTLWNPKGVSGGEEEDRIAFL
jgi:hypothetical protein